MKAEMTNLLVATVFVALFGLGSAIQCFQCDSNEDMSCPSWKPFDRNLNALVDCNSFEAHVPGTFCMKITQQSPGWRGWIKVTRRCGSRSDTGVAWGCRWTYTDNGVWREVCYCEARDGCNGSSHVSVNRFTLLLSGLTVLYVLFKQ